MKINQKQAILVLSVLASLVCETAFGFVQTGWDHPVFRANLSVQTQQGNLPDAVAGAKSIELVMTQQDGSPTPTGFVLLIDGQSKQAYTVTSATTDDCQETTYKLAPVQSGNQFILMGVFENIQVVDHSTSTCRTHFEYGWNMEMKTMDFFHSVKSDVELAGNPQSIITPF